MSPPTLRFTAWSGSELELTQQSEDEEQPTTTSDHQRHEHRRLNGNFVGNASIDCSLGSSNDEVEDCPFPSTYGCVSQPLQDRLTLRFDYEVYHTLLQPPLDFLQGSLLERVATSFNVARDCSKRRILRILQQAMPITALSSSPRDAVNAQASCQAPVETEIQQTTSCQVVQGKISVWVHSNQNSLAVTSQVLKEIRSMMSEDLLVVDTPAGSIKRLIFMGERGVDMEKSVSVPSGLSPDEPEPIGGNQTMPAAGIASLSVLVVSAVLCILFAFLRGKKREAQCQGKSMFDVQASMPGEQAWGDLETTLTSPQLTSPSTTNDQDQENDNDHDIGARSFEVLKDSVPEPNDNDDSPESKLSTNPSPFMVLESLTANDDDIVLAMSQSSSSEEEEQGLSLS